MEELHDYSGEFKPELKLQDFSKDALVRLIRAASRIYGGLDQLWYSLMKEKFGEEMAGQLQEELWMKRGGSELEVRSICTEMKFFGDDVASYFKFLQLLPAMATLMETDFELKDRNHGTMTVRRCRPLERWERTGDTKLQKQMCEVIERKAYRVSAAQFNHNMKVRPLKLPPRESKDDFACKWEFTVDQS